MLKSPLGHFVDQIGGSLRHFQGHIPCKTIGDNHIRPTLADVVAFQKSRVMDAGVLRHQGGGFLQFFMALLVFFPHIEQAHRRGVPSQNGLGKRGSHQPKLIQCRRVTFQRGPQIQHNHTAGIAGKQGRYGGTADPRDHF